jgi:hypothetical protein
MVKDGPSGSLQGGLQRVGTCPGRRVTSGWPTAKQEPGACLHSVRMKECADCAQTMPLSLVDHVCLHIGMLAPRPHSPPTHLMCTS